MTKANSAPKSQLAAQDPPEVPCDILNENGKLTVHPDPVQVIINQQRVHWQLKGDGTIRSIKTKNHPAPFKGDHTQPPPGKHVVSEIVDDPKHLHKQFKYTVIVKPTAGKDLVLDPNVEVMPPTVGPGPHVSKP